MSRVTRYAQVLVPFNALRDRQIPESVPVTSTGMIAGQGNVGLGGWFVCDLSQDPSWGLCDQSQSASWNTNDTSQTPGWVPVDDSQ